MRSVTVFLSVFDKRWLCIVDTGFVFRSFAEDRMSSVRCQHYAALQLAVRASTVLRIQLAAHLEAGEFSRCTNGWKTSSL